MCDEGRVKQYLQYDRHDRSRQRGSDGGGAAMQWSYISNGVGIGREVIDRFRRCRLRRVVYWEMWMVRWVFLGVEPFSHHRARAAPFPNVVVEGMVGQRGDMLRRCDEMGSAGLADGAVP